MNINALNGSGTAFADMYNRISRTLFQKNSEFTTGDFFKNEKIAAEYDGGKADFSSQQLNSMKDKAIISALSKRGYTMGQLSDMKMAEKVNLKSAVINEAQNTVRNAVRTKLIEENGGTITFLRGEQLSNEVVATLLFSV